MTLPRLKLQPGQSIFDQVVFAAVKAFISGDYQSGQAFPSVRALAADLKINHNTAHRVIQHLIQERWLEVHPGVGTVVAEPPQARPGDKKRLLQQELEQLVVEAKRLGLSLTDVVDGLAAHWSKLDKDPGGLRQMMIEVENVWKNYGRFDALQGLSFAVPQGSAFALIGANGAGKSTTIKCLMNIIAPSRGAATILGVDSRRISPRELAQIGYVSENQKMPGRMTVAGYLDYLRGFYPTWDRKLEAEILDQFLLPPDRRISNLSHGMRMKMALVCALCFRPKLLVLDEPFSGLDPLVRDEFMEGLLQQAGETTILISSHELSEIEGVATHIAFLDRGTLLFQESMAELMERLREVHVALDREARVPDRAPKEWLDIRAAGSVLRFVDTAYAQDRLAAKVTAAFGSVRSIDARPMGLRAIFTALARASRKGVS